MSVMIYGRSEGTDALRLQALWALSDVELDALAVLKGAVAVGLDGGVMDENVLVLTVNGDEAEALVSVEPLNGSLCHGVVPLHSSGPVPHGFRYCGLLDLCMRSVSLGARHRISCNSKISVTHIWSQRYIEAKKISFLGIFFAFEGYLSKNVGGQ